MSKECEQREANGVSINKLDPSATFSCRRWSKLTGKTVSPSDARAWRKRSQLRARTASTVAEVDAVDVLPVRLLPTMPRSFEYHEALGLSPVREQVPTRPNQFVGRVYTSKASPRDRKQQLRRQERDAIKDKIYLPAMTSRSQQLFLPRREVRTTITTTSRTIHQEQYLTRPSSTLWIGEGTFHYPPGIRLLSTDLPELRARMARHGRNADACSTSQGFYCPTPPLSARSTSSSPTTIRPHSESHRRPSQHGRAQHRILKNPSDALTVNVHYSSTNTLSGASTGSLEADIVNALEALERAEATNRSPANDTILKEDTRNLFGDEEQAVNLESTKYYHRNDPDLADFDEGVTLFDVIDGNLTKESCAPESIEPITTSGSTATPAEPDSHPGEVFTILAQQGIEDSQTIVELTEIKFSSKTERTHIGLLTSEQIDNDVVDIVESETQEADYLDLPFIKDDKVEDNYHLTNDMLIPSEEITPTRLASHANDLPIMPASFESEDLDHQSQGVMVLEPYTQVTANCETTDSVDILSSEAAKHAREVAKDDDNTNFCTSLDVARDEINRLDDKTMVDEFIGGVKDPFSGTSGSTPPHNSNESGQILDSEEDEYNEEELEDENYEAEYTETEAECTQENESKNLVKDDITLVDSNPKTPTLPEPSDEQLSHNSARRPSVSAYDADFEDEEEDPELQYYDVDEEY